MVGNYVLLLVETVVGIKEREFTKLKGCFIKELQKYFII